MFCGAQMSREDGPDGWSREHVVPLGAGGSGLRRNVVLAHWRCNNDRESAPATEVMLASAAAIYESIRIATPEYFDRVEGATKPRSKKNLLRQIMFVGHDYQPMTFKLRDIAL